MKKLIIWLAKVFKVDITRTVYKDKVEYIEKAVIIGNYEHEGDLLIKGNLTVQGSVTAKGNITCYQIKELK